MVAWLTRLLLLIQFSAGFGLWLLFTRAFGMGALPAALLAAASVIGVRLTIILNNFRMAARFRSPLPPQFRLEPGQRLALFIEEARASLTSSSWDMPFRRFDSRPGEKATLPVLLIHGYGCNSGYWKPMSAALQAAGIGHHALDLEPVFGSIDNYVAPIEQAIAALRAKSGQPRVILVAHSMGGLAVRTYLREHGAAHVAKIITIGTPHHGTALARFGAGINTQEMVWMTSEQEGLCSPWLRRLAENEDMQARSRFVSIYSHHDNIVSPQLSAHLPGARNIGLHGVGHVALVSDRRVQELVKREIESASKQARPAA